LKAIGCTTSAIVMVAPGRSSFARLAQEAGGLTDWATAAMPETAKKAAVIDATPVTAINILNHGLNFGQSIFGKSNVKSP
jgi:hypothetical protein